MSVTSETKEPVPSIAPEAQALLLGKRIKADISDGRKPVISDDDWLFIYRALMLLAATGGA